MITLTGSTWDHTRGYDPMVATARAFAETRPDVTIVWEKRTLADFAEMSLPDLAKRYDMIVLDHPWIGGCVASGALVPLDEHLPQGVLAGQAANAVGPSHASYTFNGQQWALAIDAAAQVSACRDDLLDRLDATPPGTWDEVLELAERVRARGTHVCTPLMHVDCFPTFFSLCANAGEPAFTGDIAVSRAVGRHVLGMMTRLCETGHPAALELNPPQALDRMASTDEIAYAPLLFGYTNYARPGYRPNRIHFCDIPADRAGEPAGAILGGAGLAVSSRCAHPGIAAEYAAFVASAATQCTLYFDAGGQPGHRAAWSDPRTDAAAGRFFSGTLATHDAAALRPRYPGWIEVQDAACRILHAHLSDKGDPEATLDALDNAFARSLPGREKVYAR